MEWQSQLISTYLTISSLWGKGLSEKAERFSNHLHYELSDQEIMCIYIFGIIRGHQNLQKIYDYTSNHLQDWFPKLKSYDAFNRRINRLGECFSKLADLLVDQEGHISPDLVIDSMPIIQAKQKRTARAKVSPEISSKGYSSSKGVYYYGVKLHILGFRATATLPKPTHAIVSSASTHDLKVLQSISDQFCNVNIFADKAYCDKTYQEDLKKSQNVEILTPRKNTKGMSSFPGKDCFSTAVSKVRQPIESFFSWLDEKTNIQNASKTRSTKGLIVHIFGRLAAAMMLMMVF